MPLSQKNKYQQLIKEINSRATLVAVSKKRTIAEIQFLYNLGQRDFGENRVEELLEKSLALSDLDINWHFIGNIQSKKIPKLLSINKLKYIHSVDRLKLIHILGEAKCPIELFLQMNISKESEKAGFAGVAELKEALELANKYNLKIKGLMGMAAIRAEDLELAAKDQFNALRKVRDLVNTNYDLSIGMSNDYKIALENDAKYLRIGSLLFS